MNKITVKSVLVLVTLLLYGCSLPRPVNENLWNEKYNNLNIESLEKFDEINVLSLSGGSANGAWGAGVINGLRKSGELKKYNVTTGVSTGALMATFAFLDDEKYESKLMKSYTEISVKELINVRPYTMIIFNNSLSESENLQNIIKNSITNEIIDEVYIKGQRGYKFYVGTTDLDLGDIRLFDMVEIAGKREYDKYRKILLASASIPIVYPPVFIDGNMNVDGGVCGQLFVPDKLFFLQKKVNVHIIYNGMLNALGVGVTKNNLKDISFRSLQVLQAKNDINYISIFEERSKNNENVKFFFNCVDKNIKLEDLILTKKELEELYYGGYKSGLGNTWKNTIRSDK